MKIKAFFRLVIHTVGWVELAKPNLSEPGFTVIHTVGWVELAKPNLSEPGFTGLSDFQDYSHLRISGKAIRIPQRTYSKQAVQQNLFRQSAVDLRKLTSFVPDNLPNLAKYCR